MSDIEIKKEKKEKKDKKEKKEKRARDEESETEMVDVKKEKKDKKEKKEKKEKTEETTTVVASSDSRVFPLADNSLSTTIYELVQQANSYKEVKKGANECAKALNKGRAELIILAGDADPLAILLHLPLLCEDKNVPYVFVPSRATLGRACGVARPVVACTIIASDSGKLEKQINSVRDKIDALLS